MKCGVATNCVITVTIMLFTFSVTDGQNTDGCAFAFNSSYTVSETDPPGKEILRIPSAPNVTWTMKVSYDGSSNVTSQGLLDPYVILQRQNLGDYLLTVNKMLDLEEFNERLGIVPSPLTLHLICSQQGQPDQSNDVYVAISPVNEYYPEFVGSPYSRTVSEGQAVGTLVMQMDQFARDLDVRPGTREIFEFKIVPFNFASYHGKPEDDGMDMFTMDNHQAGRIEVGKALDFEDLHRKNRTTMWLNVTARDYSGSVNWTTVKVTVADVDDLSPEFYMASVCNTTLFPPPQCLITYKVKVLINTTGIVDQIEPGPIFAHDRDTINNSVKYSLEDSAGAGGVRQHFSLDQNTGALHVVLPFDHTDVYSLYVMAKEDSVNGLTAKATLQVDVYSADYDPWGTASSDASSPNPQRPDENDPDKEMNSDTKIAVIGIAVLGAVCVVLVIALFVTILKLRMQGRVGSADASKSSRKSFVDDEEPASSGQQSPALSKQEQVLSKLPEPGLRANKLPPLLANDVFDGTKKFEDQISPGFFTAPGKVKVPLLPSGGAKSQERQPIIIDDGGSN